MEKARALVNVRDINLICSFYKTYAQIEGMTRRRKSREPAGEVAFWKSEQRLATNGCSLL